MHKTLIFQIDIGGGTQWLKDTSIDPIRKIFIPSVKNYANKYNYDYKLVNESEYLKRGGNFDFLSTKEKHYSFERYYHFVNNYDVTVYLDNDIYILDNASKLPQVDFLMNAPEPEGNSSKIFRKENNTSSNVKYYKSPIASVKELSIFHDKDYITALYQAEKKQKVSLENMKKFNIGTASNPIFKEMYRRHAVATGSLILGSDLILNKKFNYIFSPGSGAHHGKRNKASGF